MWTAIYTKFFTHFSILLVFPTHESIKASGAAILWCLRVWHTLVGSIAPLVPEMTSQTYTMRSDFSYTHTSTHLQTHRATRENFERLTPACDVMSMAWATLYLEPYLFFPKYFSNMEGYFKIIENSAYLSLYISRIVILYK